jgi:hypothetical protein
MTPIHFHAVYLPNHREFNVRVKIGGKHPVTLFEKMTIAKFLRFARNQDKPLLINRIKINFEGDDGATERRVRAYLKEIADAYVKLKYKCPDKLAPTKQNGRVTLLAKATNKEQNT